MLFSELGPRAVHVISIESPLRNLITSSLGDMLTTNVVGSSVSAATVALKRVKFYCIF
jgi:hypothetical protein